MFEQEKKEREYIIKTKPRIENNHCNDRRSQIDWNIMEWLHTDKRNENNPILRFISQVIYEILPTEMSLRWELIYEDN